MRNEDDAPELEVVEVPDEHGGGIAVQRNGHQRVWIDPAFIPALRAHLLAGAVKVELSNVPTEADWTGYDSLALAGNLLDSVRKLLKPGTNRLALVPLPETEPKE